MNQQSLVGASWAIIDGLYTLTDAAGLFNADNNTRLLDIHKVQVGTITKTLVAAVTLLLVTQGLLSLDTPVINILPELSFDNSWQKYTLILECHLLDHIAALHNLRLLHLLNSKARPNSELDEIFNSDLDLLQVSSPPGEYFS